MAKCKTVNQCVSTLLDGIDNEPIIWWATTRGIVGAIHWHIDALPCFSVFVKTRWQYNKIWLIFSEISCAIEFNNISQFGWNMQLSSIWRTWFRDATWYYGFLSALFRVKALRLFGTSPLTEPLLAYSQLNEPTEKDSYYNTSSFFQEIAFWNVFRSVWYLPFLSLNMLYKTNASHVDDIRKRLPISAWARSQPIERTHWIWSVFSLWLRLYLTTSSKRTLIDIFYIYEMFIRNFITKVDNLNL